MTATLTRQYRPIATSETAADDALTVRAIYELACSMNNFKAHMAGKIYGRIGTLITNPNSTTAEKVIDAATRPIAPGYTHLMFQIGGLMASGSAGNTTWKLYSSTEPYAGPDETFDAKYLGSSYAVSTGIAINSTSDMCPVAVDDLTIQRDTNGYTHLTLTATNSASGEFEYSALWCVATTPKVIIS